MSAAQSLGRRHAVPPEFLQRRGREIFVETQSETISNSVRSGILRELQMMSLLMELENFPERKLQRFRAYGAPLRDDDALLCWRTKCRPLVRDEVITIMPKETQRGFPLGFLNARCGNQ